jgi:hypothetical protein
MAKPVRLRNGETVTELTLRYSKPPREVKNGMKYRNLREANKAKFNEALRTRGVTIL